MSVLRNVYDKEVPTRNLVTTISGVVTLAITILVGLNVISAEDQPQVQNYASLIIQSAAAIWGAVSGLILIFKAKD